MRIDEINAWQGEDADYSELSGNIFKKLVSTLKKKAKKSKGVYKIVTPKGTATISPEGVDIQKGGTKDEGGGGMEPIKTGLSQMFENPVILLIPAALLAMFIIKKKKSR